MDRNLFIMLLAGVYFVKERIDMYNDMDVDMEYDCYHCWTLLMAAVEGGSCEWARWLIDDLGAKADWMHKIGTYKLPPKISEPMKKVLLPLLNRPPPQRWPPKPHLEFKLVTDNEDYIEDIRMLLQRGNVDVNEISCDGSGWSAHL